MQVIRLDKHGLRSLAVPKSPLLLWVFISSLQFPIFQAIISFAAHIIFPAFISSRKPAEGTAFFCLRRSQFPAFSYHRSFRPLICDRKPHDIDLEKSMVEKPITRGLPPHTSLSPLTLYYLNSKFGSSEDLSGAPNQLSDLRTSCDSLQERIAQLSDQIWSQLSVQESNSVRAASLFDTVKAQLSDLRRTTSPRSSSSNEGLGQELQSLAKEVARVEAVREYAETTLKLVTLVGDLEDSVSSAMNRTVRKQSANNAEDARAVALNTLKLTEDILSLVSKKHPRWSQLVSTVDHRVDRALAIIRPQAIADHRNLLASLGWPPPLSSTNSLNPNAKGSVDVKNPLLTMQRDLKQQYCESFLALCSLQELQSRRKLRQLEGQYKDVSLHQPLWAVEELVNPLSVASQRHITKWIDKPEYIFALVYKITRDYVDSMDDLLQPLVDEAMLSGYSCREEWISAMVSSLSTYLAKEIFPTYVGQLEGEVDATIQAQARVSWLHLVDLMISFDKRIQSLASHLGTVLNLDEDGGNSQKMSSLCVFCDRPDWLDLWAKIELDDLLGKLKPHIEDERNWINQDQGVSLLSGPEDDKAPLVSGVIVRRLSSVIDRCRSLPNVSLRSRFVKMIGQSTVNRFMDCLLQRCQEAEGLTALTDDNALTKVARSVNAGRYLEAVLKEWCEDLFFIEMGSNQTSELSDDVNTTNLGSFESLTKTIFDEEIEKLAGFSTEWVEKLSTVILRGFDARSRDYIKNKRQWQEKGVESSALSRPFVDAMDYLQGKMSALEAGLNKMDFTRVWRNIASGIDKLIFNGLMMGNIKFYDGGVERLSNDLMVLFGVFGSWCLRPEGFFPKVSEGLTLLKMESKQLKSTLISEERWLKENGIRHLNAAEVEKIAKNRVFNG